jgi:UDP-N-acetyl-2-amino-2-deoxyglucuronate dehydrogenase
MKRFALIGAAGYVAPVHMKAIRDTGSQLVAAFDPADSVGIIDNYFPDADFFREFEPFDRHIHKMSRNQTLPVDFISICSPNYLHDSHVRFALGSNTDAICEKPAVLNGWNIDALQSIEKDPGRKVYTVLQLRLHPSIVELKKMVAQAGTDTKFDIELTYIISRGKWYFNSWKGDEKKSGGLVTNIGIHFFDMLGYVFGKTAAENLTLSG